MDKITIILQDVVFLSRLFHFNFSFELRMDFSPEIIPSSTVERSTPVRKSPATFFFNHQRFHLVKNIIILYFLEPN